MLTLYVISGLVLFARKIKDPITARNSVGEGVSSKTGTLFLFRVASKVSIGVGFEVELGEYP